MSTRKIMNAKDLSTNELIYFRSHAKATYMSDGTTTVEDAISTISDEVNSFDVYTKQEVDDKIAAIPTTTFQYVINESEVPIERVPGVVYLVGDEIDYTKNYCTIEALEDGLTAKLSANACQCSTDGFTWKSLSAGTTTPAINTGEKLYFKATGLTPTSSAGIGTFTVNKNFNLKGNCMSMLFGDEAETNLDLTGKSYAFFRLFYNCKTLKSVSSEFLPATTLASYCYRNMFYGCTGLTTAPGLPAITLAQNCYYSMFSGCTNLTTAPELPATTLANNCYQYMFYGCTGLTTAPGLPAITLAQNCYYSMFSGCTNLTTAPELPATTLVYRCYQQMLQGCTGLTTAPELPATTLADSCYASMFSGCSNLNYIKAMFTTTPSASYTNNWVSGVASTGTFVKNPDATWDVTGVNGIPEGWTVTTLITFVIDDGLGDGSSYTYQAEEGMTWREFINSNYDHHDITIDSEFVKFKDRNLYSGYDQVQANDIIISNWQYNTNSAGGGN